MVNVAMRYRMNTTYRYGDSSRQYSVPSSGVFWEEDEKSYWQLCLASDDDHADASRTNERTNERFAFCVIIWRDRQVAPKKTAGKDTTETCVSQWLERENDKNYGSENRIGTAGRVPGILFH
jgi:hypothetical protein